MKNDQSRVLRAALVHSGGFSAILYVVHSRPGIRTKLYPKSVGASVDKVFALLCNPVKLWATRF